MSSTVTSPPQRFATMFREEHRVVRDLLLDLVAAFEEGRQDRAAALLHEVAAATGPHFRYEEESLYPALVPIFGAEYVDKLLGDHDFAIASARRLVELAGREALDADEKAEAIRLVRGILPHVSDCDGLSIMVEVLADATVEGFFAARERSLEENLDLLTWAAEVRPRRA